MPEPDRKKAPNPFVRRVRSLNEVKGPTDDEVSEALWGHKDGPLAARQQQRPQPGQGGQHGG